MTITWQAEDTVEPIADTTIEGIANFNNYSVTSGCGLTYSGANMTVTVAAGSVLHNGSTVTVAGNNVTLVADATNPRWTWIGVPSTGTAAIISGTAAATPTVPEIGDYVPLALVYVQANLTVANNATYKLDKRVLYTGPNAVLTTTGDLIYASAANTPARLAVGSADKYLTVSGGVPVWSAASYFPTSKYKSAAQTFSASTTFATVTASSGNFDFSIAANEVWIVQCRLMLTFTGSGGLKLQLTGPASPTSVTVSAVGSQILFVDGALSNYPSIFTVPTGNATAFSTEFAGVQAGTITNTYYNSGISTPANWVEFYAVIANGSNAGTVTVQAAQKAANGTTALGVGSFFTKTRIA